MYPPTALKRQAPSSFIFLMTNPFFSRSAFSNQCSCCNRGRISEQTQWGFIIMRSINRQTSNATFIVGTIYFEHLKFLNCQEHHEASHIFMQQQHQNFSFNSNFNSYASCFFNKHGCSQLIINWR